DADVTILEGEYGSKKGSKGYNQRLASDIATYLEKGANAVAKAIRNIIQKLAIAVLSLGVAFNQGSFVDNAQAVTMPLPQTKTQFIQVVENPRADFGNVKPSATAATIADWVVGTDNNKGKPFKGPRKPRNPGESF
ncbi:MAG: hypothetical protein EBV38_07865, partial [Burkholderiaceae bacterium]|nr:hypothetical protein [Burkholderiaceae bacterium]